MDFRKRAQAEMFYFLISEGGRVEGWIFKKGPSGDVDDLRHGSISRFQRVEGWIFKKGPKRRCK